MWILFVVNTVFTVEGGEIKWTRFAEYENELSCFVEKEILETQFEAGELALCYKLDVGSK